MSVSLLKSVTNIRDFKLAHSRRQIGLMRKEWLLLLLLQLATINLGKMMMVNTAMPFDVLGLIT